MVTKPNFRLCDRAVLSIKFYQFEPLKKDHRDYTHYTLSLDSHDMKRISKQVEEPTHITQHTHEPFAVERSDSIDTILGRLHRMSNMENCPKNGCLCHAESCLKVMGYSHFPMISARILTHLELISSQNSNIIYPQTILKTPLPKLKVLTLDDPDLLYLPEWITDIVEGNDTVLTHPHFVLCGPLGFWIC